MRHAWLHLIITCLPWHTKKETCKWDGFVFTVYATCNSNIEAYSPWVGIAMSGSFAKVVPTDAPDAPHEVVEKGGEDPTSDEDQSTLVQFTTAIYFVEESDTWHFLVENVFVDNFNP